MKQPLVCLLMLSLLLSSCAYFRQDDSGINTSGYNLKQVLSEMAPMDISVPYQPTAAISNYFHFYDLNSSNVPHWFGTIESEGHTLAAHLFVPENAQGTLFLIHGYFDHTGTLSKLITEGLKRNYAVAVWDLPGHGLSSGNRTETGDFDLCSEQFIDLVDRTKNKLPQPFFLIAHSTGASITLEYLHSDQPDAFEQIVLIAPLIRHTHWNWAKFGYTISKPFTNHVRRRNKNNSSDKAYLAFVKQDPLHSSILSYEYLADLYAWEKTVHDYPVLDDRLIVIQGTDDDIVDWRYNLDFLYEKFTDPKIQFIENGKHQLLNERDELREKTIDFIFDAL